MMKASNMKLQHERDHELMKINFELRMNEMQARLQAKLEANKNAKK